VLELWVRFVEPGDRSCETERIERQGALLPKGSQVVTEPTCNASARTTGPPFHVSDVSRKAVIGPERVLRGARLGSLPAVTHTQPRPGDFQGAIPAF